MCRIHGGCVGYIFWPYGLIDLKRDLSRKLKKSSLNYILRHAMVWIDAFLHYARTHVCILFFYSVNVFLSFSRRSGPKPIQSQ